MPAALRTGPKAFIAALCSSFNEEMLYGSQESAVTAAVPPPPPPPAVVWPRRRWPLVRTEPWLFADWSYLKKGSQTGAFQYGSATYTDFPAVELPNAAVCDVWNRGQNPIGTMELHIVRAH